MAEHFGLTKIPSKSTVLRILKMVNAEIVSLCTVNIMREFFGTGGDVIAVKIRLTSLTGKE
ncbi:MAG: hypothetical protein LUG24_01060 [Clostridiales bacterium]|nr:hypothetical protein [Clostridiales bacterium]